MSKKKKRKRKGHRASNRNLLRVFKQSQKKGKKVPRANTTFFNQISNFRKSSVSPPQNSLVAHHQWPMAQGLKATALGYKND